MSNYQKLTTHHTKTTTCKPQNTDLLQLGLFTLLFYSHARIFANLEKVQNIARGGTGLYCRYVRSKANKQRKRHFPKCLCGIYTGASYLAPLKTIFYYLFTTTMKNYDKKQLKEIASKAYSSKGYDKDYNFIGWYVPETKSYITEEEKEQAQNELVKLKREKRKEYKNGEDFRLCAMGSTRNDIDFNNHRARAEFITPDHKQRFVEFTTRTPRGEKEPRLHLDFLINRTMEREYNEKVVEIRERNKDKFFYSWSEEDRNNWEKYNKQPYYWEKTHEGEDFLKGKPATKQTALEMINYLFGTNFKKLDIIDYLIPADWLNWAY